jgi:glyoxylase-like metal-dependent hydrolase (beta-lactamase superfamily II)
MRSAYPTEWEAMLDRALAMDVDIYVPGHGPVTSPVELRSGLETYREALGRVIAEARRLHADGVPVEEAADEARFGDLRRWALYESQAPRALQRVYMELDGELP